MRIPRHRTYEIGHSHAGFRLTIRDEAWPAWAADHVINAVLVALGHPCCGAGPIGRLPGAHWAGEALLNAPNRWHCHDRPVADLALSTTEAVGIAPRWQQHLEPDGHITVNGEDEDGDVWADARLVAVRCPNCGELVDAAGRWAVKVLEDHTCGRD